MSAFAAKTSPDGTRQLGENGMAELTAAGVGSAHVALFFAIVRGVPRTRVAELVEAVVRESKAAGGAAGLQGLVDLVVVTMQTRNCRGGKGERDAFDALLLELYKRFPATVCRLLKLVPHFGYFKDFFRLLRKVGEEEEAAAAATNFAPLREAVMSAVVTQLRADAAELDAAAAAGGRTPKLSLLAKWIPKENKSLDKKLGWVKACAARLGLADRAAYRRLVSRLNAALCTTEVLMSARRWEEIEFGKVASLCLMRHRKAFLNEKCKGALTAEEQETGNRHPGDAGRVACRKRLRGMTKTPGALKSKQLMPHEIVNKLSRHGGAERSTAELEIFNAQWDGLREGVRAALAEAAPVAEAEASAAAAAESAPRASIDLGRLVALVDVSGSMSGTPMDVAVALGILVSELTHPAFRDRFITFHESPTWCSLAGCTSIQDKVASALRAPWGMSTNFEAALELLASAVEEHGLAAADVPDLIVLSDMQFDSAVGRSSWTTQHERVVARFAAAGRRVCGTPYAPPKIVYWNLRAGGALGFPAAADTPNVQLLSGFSPALMKLILTAEPLEAGEEEAGPTPLDTFRAAVDDAAYDVVRVALAEETEGPFAAYSFTPPDEDMEEADDDDEQAAKKKPKI